MSEANTPALQKEESEIIQKKRAAWGNLGVTVHETEQLLNLRAQAAVSKIKMPANIAEVPEAESQLKELKSAQKSIEAERKAITSKLDDLSQRLMLPEKSLNEPITNLSNSIIAIKKEEERIQQIKVLKAQEISSLKERIKSYLSQKDFEFRSDINNKVTQAYQHALQKDIKPEGIAEYINACVKKVGAIHFAVDRPGITLKYVLPEEYEQILEETFVFDANGYVELLGSELTDKFADYDVAYQNKQAALQLAEKEAAEKEAQLQKDLENQQIANKMEAASTPIINEAPQVKALKKSYEVDMPENMENAIKILSAFAANRTLCLPKLRVTKWFAFTPAQAATALAKVKCDDNNFQPLGIIFKEVDKL
jgi:hypothetical protein